MRVHFEVPFIPEAAYFSLGSACVFLPAFWLVAVFVAKLADLWDSMHSDFRIGLMISTSAIIATVVTALTASAVWPFIR